MEVMKTMKISDIDFDFFARLKTIDARLYDQLFTNEDPKNIDARATALYASRILFPSDTVIDDGHISDSMVYGIALAYGPKWKGYAKALDVDFETAMNPYQMKTVHESKSDSTSKSNGTDGTENGVFGFDSSESVNDTTSNITSENSETKNNTTNFTTTVSGNKGNATYADIARSHIRLLQLRLVDIIISDVIGELTLSIY